MKLKFKVTEASEQFCIVELHINSNSMPKESIYETARQEAIDQDNWEVECVDHNIEIETANGKWAPIFEFDTNSNIYARGRR